MRDRKTEKIIGKGKRSNRNERERERRARVACHSSPPIRSNSLVSFVNAKDHPQPLAYERESFFTHYFNTQKTITKIVLLLKDCS